MFKAFALTSVIAMILFTACATDQKNTDAKATPEKQTISKEMAAQKEVTENTGTITCKNKRDVRTIGIKTEGSSCSVVYKKYGSENTVATGNSASSHCKTVHDRIKSNLEAAGFTCN